MGWSRISGSHVSRAQRKEEQRATGKHTVQTYDSTHTSHAYGYTTRLIGIPSTRANRSGSVRWDGRHRGRRGSRGTSWSSRKSSVSSTVVVHSASWFTVFASVVEHGLRRCSGSSRTSWYSANLSWPTEAGMVHAATASGSNNSLAATSQGSSSNNN